MTETPKGEAPKGITTTGTDTPFYKLLLEAWRRAMGQGLGRGGSSSPGEEARAKEPPSDPNDELKRLNQLPRK